MILRYIVKRTNIVCPEDWYIGGCPLTGQYLRVRVGELSQKQLAAWLKNDPTNAGKYVKVAEVPEKVEPAAKKRRKPKKTKIDASETASNTTKDEEAETPQDTGDSSQ